MAPAIAPALSRNSRRPIRIDIFISSPHHDRLCACFVRFQKKETGAQFFAILGGFAPGFVGHAVINTSLRFSRTLVAVVSLFLLPAVWAEPAPQSRNYLQVYFVDV